MLESLTVTGHFRFVATINTKETGDTVDVFNSREPILSMICLVKFGNFG